MGGFNPISTAIGAVPILGTARGAYNDYRRVTGNYEMARAAQDQAERNIATETANQLKAIEAQAEADDAARRNALKRTMAKQRAAFGASGIDAADGSGQAVLLGMFSESAEEKNYRDRLDNLRRNALRQNADNRRRGNLLTLRDAQLTARDRLINL